jgi:hypothetical protein
MLSSKTIGDLKGLCLSFDIEISKNARKQDIIEAIEEAKVTWEMYEESSKSLFDYEDGPTKEEIKVKIEESKVESKKEEKVLLTMAIKRGGYYAGNGVKFDMDEPFVLVNKSLAEQILANQADEVREATKKEVESFYGV